MPDTAPAAELFDVTGLRVLVTGAGPIGCAIAEVLAASGAHVTLVDREATLVGAARQALRDAGLEVDTEVIDVSGRAEVRALVARLVEAHGRLDVAFVGARAANGTGYLDPSGGLDKVKDGLWSDALDVNLHGAFYAIQAAADPMKRQGTGRIAVIGATAARRSDPLRGYGDVAAGAALVNAARQAAFELARSGVTINVVIPGPFRGEADGPLGSEDEERYAASVPLGRVGEPDDIKGLALLLASRASSFMTGAVISVDGGALVRQNAVPAAAG